MVAMEGRWRTEDVWGLGRMGGNGRVVRGGGRGSVGAGKGREEGGDEGRWVVEGEEKEEDGDGGGRDGGGGREERSGAT